MKKLTMICMSALLMLAVSCKKDKKDEIENAGSGFRATVESHEGTGKTHLEGLAVKWDSGDAILVKSGSCSTPERFTTTDSGASATFEAEGALPEDFYKPGYTAYYPGLQNNPAGVYFSDDQLTLPATQTYVANAATFASGANPMAARSPRTVLPFKNVCGVLKLQLYSATACKVRSISITTSNADEKLWGTGTVSFTTDDLPALGTLSNGGNTLTLNMGTTGEDMSTIAGSPSAYYFVVPANTLGTSFTVKVTETNGYVWTKTASSPDNLIVRSQITVLPKQAVETKPDIPDGALPGLFSVSATKKVYFSQGNLQRVRNGETWDDNTCTWRFAANQWETVEMNDQDVGTNYVNAPIQTLFGWGDMSGKTSETSSDYTWTADWGTKIDDKGTWRTLTSGEDEDNEWYYLLNTRTMKYVSFRYTSKVSGITVGGTNYKGLFIYPDDYNGTEVGKDTTTDTWEKIKNLGIVFLPAAGERSGTSVEEVGTCGYYWSPSYDSVYGARGLFFATIVTSNYYSRRYGHSVRLVSDYIPPVN